MIAYCALPYWPMVSLKRIYNIDPYQEALARVIGLFYIDFHDIFSVCASNNKTELYIKRLSFYIQSIIYMTEGHIKSIQT